MKKKFKMPRILLVTIILGIISLSLLGISIWTSATLVHRVEDAISDIVEVKLDDDTETKIDLANKYYLELDRNINLDKKVKNIKDLDNAKYNYARLSIKKALVSNNRKVIENISEETISTLVNDANRILNKYFSKDGMKDIEGYDEFQYLLDKYKEEKEENPKEDNNTSSDEKPEIC